MGDVLVLPVATDRLACMRPVWIRHPTGSGARTGGSKILPRCGPLGRVIIYFSEAPR